MKNSSVVITAGGTVEPIDDVRAITNFSRGEVGLALVREALSRGREVFFFASPTVRGAPPAGAKVIPFGSAQSLSDALTAKVRELAAGAGVYVLHAAAVADYAPVPVLGKIPSDREELTLTLKKTPKIVDSLKRPGDTGIALASFKLLSRKDGRDVREVARAQLLRTRSDLVVANYVEDVKGESYTGWVIPARGAEAAVSSREEMARVALDLLFAAGEGG
jgi:phosphopantothenoylcysteine decarboxylase / phosphopantothenate---cysteine ligase